MLAAWKAQGTDQLDPVRFQFLLALARRAATCPPDVQALLTRRLTALMAKFPQRMQRPMTPCTDVPRPRSPLSRLLDDIRAAQPVDTSVGGAAPRFTGLKALHWFKGSWTRLQMQQHIVQSQASVPDKPGPLNSQRLLLEALTQLRSLSPDYLDLYLSHVDTLLWLEQAEAGAADPGPEDRRSSSRTARRPGGRAARNVRQGVQAAASRARDGTQ